MKIISSRQNQLIKELKKQSTAHGRKKQIELIFAEGKRACSPFFESPYFELHTLLCTADLITWADEQKISDDKIVQTTKEIIEEISNATTPSGVIGVFSPIKHSIKRPLSTSIVLANIQDPGNMGTLIRTATAFGAECIIVGGTSPYHPKVIQSSAGTIAHAKIRIMNWDALRAQAKKETANLIALVPTGGAELNNEIKKNKTPLLVVGNEAHGIPEEWIADCTSLATLSTQQEVESLNAAIAGSIALYLVTQI